MDGSFFLITYRYASYITPQRKRNSSLVFVHMAMAQDSGIHRKYGIRVWGWGNSVSELELSQLRNA